MDSSKSQQSLNNSNTNPSVVNSAASDSVTTSSNNNNNQQAQKPQNASTQSSIKHRKSFTAPKNNVSPVLQLEVVTRAALQSNLSPQRFLKLFSQFQERIKIDQKDALDALFKSQHDTRSVDSLFLQYLVALAYDFKSSLFLPRLLFFLRYIQIHPESFQSKPETLAFYEPLLYVALAKSLDLWPLSQINNSSNQQQYYNSSNSSSGKQPDMNKTIIIVFIAIISDCLRIENPSSVQKIRAFSSFLLAFSTSGHANAVIGSNKDFYGNEFKRFEEAFIKFCARLAEIEPTISNELQKEYSIVFGKGMALTTADSFGKPSRVFWLIWLDSMMKFRKLHHASFRNELEYFFLTESTPTIISDLITTSIDMIAVSIGRKDASFVTHTWRAFLIKRVPSIIKSLIISSKSAAPSAQIELAVSQALISIPKDTQGCIQSFFNPGSSHIDDMFLSSYQSSVQDDIRFHFLKALISLGIVQKSCLSKVLGVTNNQLDNLPITKVNDEALKNQGLIIDSSNSMLRQEFLLPNIVVAAKIENVGNVAFEESNILKLVTIFENIEGVYQEAVAREIFQLYNFWIESLNTQNLGRLVQALLFKPAVIDVLFLHIPMSYFTNSMSQLLENWKHDEDEVNMRDLYADFGSVLLFIIFLYQRYNLDLTDLGIQPPPMNLGNTSSRPSYANNNDKNKQITQHFVVTAIRQAGTCKPLEEFSPEKNALVGDWICALFEEGMISDDLINKTSPKDLYELVPTILSQAVAACAAEVIDFDTLKGGLEFFRQSFLLPTLVPAIRYICNSIWNENELQILLRVLENILLSESTGVDQILLSTVLSITGQELLYMVNAINCASGSIQNTNEFDSSRYIVEPRLLSLLESYYTKVSPTEYLLNQKDNLANLVKKQISDLAKWSPTESLPPVFHGELLYTTVKEIGATNTLFILLDHLDTAKNTGMGSATVDVVTSLTTVPSLGKSRTYFQKYDSNILKTIIDFQPDEILAIREEAYKQKQRIQLQSTGSQETKPNIQAQSLPKQRINNRGKPLSNLNGLQNNASGPGLTRKNTGTSSSSSSTNPLNSKNESPDLLSSFTKIKQAIQTFHDRRRNMESIITRRASQAHTQAQSRLSVASAHFHENGQQQLQQHQPLNSSNNGIGATEGGFGSMGPGDIKSPEMYRQ